MRFFLYMCFLIQAIFIFTYNAEAERLTLQQAIHTATINNPDIKALSWSIEAQENHTNVAKGRLYPRLHVEEKILRTDNPTFGFMAKLNQERFSQQDFLVNRLNNPDDITDIQTLLTIEQPLFVPKIHLGHRMAHRELKAKETEFEMRKEAVALDVINKYLGVQTAQEYLTSAEKGLDDAIEHKRLATLRFDVGTAVYADKLRADVALKKAKALLARAKADLEVSRRALGLILGRTDPVDVTDDRISLPLRDIHTFITASENRKDIEALVIRHENARTGIKVEKSGFLPEIGIRGSFQLNDHESPFSPDGESYMVMGFLRWNLFDVSTYSKIKKAKAEANMVNEHLSALRNRIKFKVHDSFIRVSEKEQNLILSKSILKEAEEAVRLVRLRYENSLASIVDLLDTQLMLNDARAGLVRAESDYISSIADLHYQSGMLMSTLTNMQKDSGGNDDK